MTTCLLLSTLAVLTLACLTSACDPDMMPPGKGFKYTMENAKVVFHGKVLGEVDDASRDVLVEVYCVYKYGDTVPSNYTGNFTIDGGYQFNSCTTTWMDFGKEYIIALVKSQYGYYEMYEPNISTPGAYEADDDKLDELACSVSTGETTNHYTGQHASSCNTICAIINDKDKSVGDGGNKGHVIVASGSGINRCFVLTICVSVLVYFLK